MGFFGVFLGGVFLLFVCLCGVFFPSAVQVSKSRRSPFLITVMQDSDIHQPSETFCSVLFGVFFVFFLLWKRPFPKRIETATKPVIPHVCKRNSVKKRKNKKYIFHLHHYFRQDCFSSEREEVLWREKEIKFSGMVIRNCELGWLT